MQNSNPLPWLQQSKGEEMMDTMSGSFRLERSSWRKVGRSNSSLLASELVSSEIAKVVAYKRLSESMRVTANDSSGGYSSRRRNKIRGWSFLVRAFSFRKRFGGGKDVRRGEAVVEGMVKPPEVVVVVVAEKKKKSAVWFPNPHRRWPVQGW